MGSLQEDFKAACVDQKKFGKDNSTTLSYRVNDNTTNYYDFLTRIMTVNCYYSAGIDLNTIPFSQLDAETLDVMRDKLIELGGTPPALPETQKATKAKLAIKPHASTVDKRITGIHQ